MDWKDLISNLDQQKTKHRELLLLLKKEEELPIDTSAGELEKLNGLRKQLVDELTALEKNRRGMIKESFSDHESANTNLKKLLPFCDDENQRQGLLESREELMEIITEIRKQNKKNETAVKGRRYAIQDLRENLNAKLSSMKLYSGKGTAFSTKPSNMMQRWI